jgi:hypothetical protein
VPVKSCIIGNLPNRMSMQEQFTENPVFWEIVEMRRHDTYCSNFRDPDRRNNRNDKSRLVFPISPDPRAAQFCGAKHLLRGGTESAPEQRRSSSVAICPAQPAMPIVPHELHSSAHQAYRLPKHFCASLLPEQVFRPQSIGSRRVQAPVQSPPALLDPGSSEMHQAGS